MTAVFKVVLVFMLCFASFLAGVIACLHERSWMSERDRKRAKAKRRGKG